MVSRNVHSVEDILYSESLNCHPAENQAAKIFAKWLKEHTEYPLNEIDMRIDSYRQEEDYYGNGGGTDQYVRILKHRKETNDEYNERIKKEESSCFKKFENEVKKQILHLIQDLNIYPYQVCEDIKKKQEEITNEIMKSVHYALEQK